MSLTPTAPTNPSTGDYNFVLLTTVPGWSSITAGGTGAGTTFAGLIGGMVEYLQELILETFSYAAQNGSNPLQNITSNDNWVSLDVTFQSNLDAADVVTLTNLVNRMADYFIVTTDGSTSLGNPAVYTTTSGANSGVSFILVYLQGDGTVRTGLTDAVFVNVPPTTISTTTGNMSSTTGEFDFQFGTQTMKGTLSAVITVGLLQPMTLNVSWT